MVHTDLRWLLRVQPQGGKKVRHRRRQGLDRPDPIPASGAAAGDPGQGAGTIEGPRGLRIHRRPITPKMKSPLIFNSKMYKKRAFQQ